MTPLDALHAAMAAKPEDEATSRAYFARLLASDLVLALEGPAEETVRPRLVTVEDHDVALAFDSEARFASLGGAPDYLSLPGRDLAQMLAGAGLGLGLNLASEGAALHLSPDDVAWLAEQPVAPEEASAQIRSVRPPASAPEALLEILDARLAMLEGMAETALLVEVERDLGDGLLLVFTGAVPPMRSQLAGHVAEALKVGGIEVPLDVAFADPGDPILPAAHRHGLQFDLPKPETPGRTAPGSNPDKPPRLH